MRAGVAVPLAPPRASQVTLVVKNQLAMQETWVWDDPLEKEMATHSSILVWKISWTEGSGGPMPWGHKESGVTY